jgi:uncharacterized membrane protein
MQSLIFFSCAAAAALLSRIIGKRWYAGYFLGGLAFGIYNEFCFEFCWTYSPALAPMIWRDVPLIVVLGWGLVALVSLTLSNAIIVKCRVLNPWMDKLLDVLFFFCLGYSIELIMSKLGYWKYNFDMMEIPWSQVMGYFFVGILVSFAGRGMQQLIDNRIRSAQGS